LLENIWTYEKESSGRVERLHNEELHNLYASKLLLRWSNQEGWDWHGT